MQPFQFPVEPLFQGRRGFFLLFQPGGFLFQPGGVVAFEGKALAPGQFQNPSRDVVQEIPVVSGNDHVPRVGDERFLQPLDGFRVEVVGGFVEQKDIGFLQEQFAQGHPPRLAAGQGGGFLIVRGKQQGVHGDVDLAVQLPAVDGVDLILEPAHPVQRLLHFLLVHRLGHFGAQGVELLDQVLDAGKGVLDVLAHGPVALQPGFLGKVTDPGAFQGFRKAVELLILSGHDAEQGGLAGTVFSDDADFGAVIKAQADSVEDLFFVVGLGQVAHGENIFSCHSSFFSPC